MKIKLATFGLLLTLTGFAHSFVDKVLVPYNDKTVNILHLSNLEDTGVNALLNLKSACFQGDKISVIDKLNDIFNMIERNPIASTWEIDYRQATTPNIPEQNAGLGETIGIEYEMKRENWRIVRFTIKRCE